jgi:hypothetical protein
VPDLPLDLYDLKQFPIRSDIAAEHREAVRKWIRHARDNGYRLRFALIPFQPGIGTEIYGEYREFIAGLGGRTWDFEEFVLESGPPAEDLFWARDFHFNARGNAAYARFLMEQLRAEARAGALPARFAGSE